MTLKHIITAYYFTAVLIVLVIYQAGTNIVKVKNTEHAGYVVFRKTEHNDIQYLLLKPKWGLDEWILPESAVHFRETINDAAIRALYLATTFTNEDITGIVTEKPFQPDNSTSYILAYVTNISKEVYLSAYYEDFKWLHIKEACELADRISKIVLLQVDEYLKYIGF